MEMEKNMDLLIVAERLRELTDSLFSTISILKNPPENAGKYVFGNMYSSHIEICNSGFALGTPRKLQHKATL
jgi:hypothetical protein